MRAFASFFNNHVQWENTFHTISQNETTSNLWIRSEPQSPLFLLMLQGRRLISPMKTRQLRELQENVISTYVNQISKQQHLALEGSKHGWQTSPSILKKRDPYCFINFKQALPRVKGYVDYMKKCGVHWLGLKYKFLLIWWPAKPYMDDYTMTQVGEKKLWKYWVSYKGYLEGGELPKSSYNFSSLH